MATLGITLSPPAPPYTFIGVAENIMPGIRVLAAHNPGHEIAWPIAMLAAHALECILKAYLSRSGSLDKGHINHELLELWASAQSQGFGIPAQPPTWVNDLSRLHGRPYSIRYAEKAHAYVLPALQPMATELPGLLESVKAEIHKWRKANEK